MDGNGWTIQCDGHIYVTLKRNDHFVHCFDNDFMFMEDVILLIEQKTGMKIQDIPRKSDLQSFDGLNFRYGGKKKGSEWLCNTQ